MKGDGLKWQDFTVTAASRPSRMGCEGAELAAPAWKYTLTVGKKGVSFDTKLPKKQYKTKWIIAEKA